MGNEQVGIPPASAKTQQLHHARQANDRKPQPEPAPVAAAALVKQGPDLNWLCAVGRAIRCVLRPYPIDDADPRGTWRRVAVVVAGAVGTVALLVARKRAR